MPGVNLIATRTYDSRDKDTSGDFGYGWSLTTTNMAVETSSVLGAGFIQTETQLPATQVNPLGDLGSLGGLGGIRRAAWNRPAARPGEPPSRDPVQLPEHPERLRDHRTSRRDGREVPHGIHRGDLHLRRPALGHDEYLFRPGARHGHDGDPGSSDEQQCDRVARAGRAGLVHRPIDWPSLQPNKLEVHCRRRHDLHHQQDVWPRERH